MKKLVFSVILTALSCSVFANDFDEGKVVKGYRGFTDLSYTLGVGDYGKNHNRINLMTSHGYQILPQLYVGAGVGVNYFYDDDAWNIPIFAHFRSDILNNKNTPFVDLRVGYSAYDVKGFYLNPAIGYRIGVSDIVALNLSVGYTMQQADYGLVGKKNCGGVDFRIGIDF